MKPKHKQTDCCIHCGAPFVVRPRDHVYPDNAPLWPWRYCDKCIVERPNNNPKIVEER